MDCWADDENESEKGPRNNGGEMNLEFVDNVALDGFPFVFP